MKNNIRESQFIAEIAMLKAENWILKNKLENNIFYKVECLNEEGEIECNGYYKSREDALCSKEIHDTSKSYAKYSIKQNIIECEFYKIGRL